MLIIVIGPHKAGKDVLAQHLVTKHGFRRVRLGAATGRDASNATGDALWFSSSSAFLDYATRTWRRDYVCTDMHSHLKLQEFVKRPFVAVVAVDAPLGVRFRRAVAESVYCARHFRRKQPS